jgi:predicted phage baseplate assembly protein
MTSYVCTNLRRLQAVRLAGVLNGIEYVEVRDRDEPVQSQRQRTLFVRLLLPVPAGFGPGNVGIDGGERIHDVPVQWAAVATALPVSPAEQAQLLDGLDQPDHVFVVRTTIRGDFSRYHLDLVAGASSSAPPAGFDPLLTTVDFLFKVECPSPFDCRLDCQCPARVHTAPSIDYLAKDFDGFRRIMLERMALVAPGWVERNAADLGVTLVELLAYVADELSYRQDAVATEAYLHTARSRVSLRRLVRLVDWRVHEGCNARAWVHLAVADPTVAVPARTQLFTTVPGLPAHIAPNTPEDQTLRNARPVVFETVDEAVLHLDLNEMDFWTWGEQGCCLPVGATSATLRNAHPQLRAGDVLVLGEMRSPTTGEIADADPTRRWAVRLTDVRESSDPSGGLFDDPPTNAVVAVTEIRWDDADALPFPLCISVVDSDRVVGKAWGNVVLADHGETVQAETLPAVPAPIGLVPVGPNPDCADGTELEIAARFRPVLAQRPLTRAIAAPATVRFEAPLTAALRAELNSLTFGPLLQEIFAAHSLESIPVATASVQGADPLWSVSDGDAVVPLRADGGTLQVLGPPGAATTATRAAPRDAHPYLDLLETTAAPPRTWQPQFDLLGSKDDAQEFVCETESDGTTFLRFGDNRHGLRPATGAVFEAHYRIGNGAAGNVGADAIGHVVTTAPIADVRNFLPAAGGRDPESADEIRRDAPAAFAVQERAVTVADWSDVTERDPQVQRAAATYRWTGSWHTVFLTADRIGGASVDAPFEAALRERVERYRLAGYDLEVDGPQPVAVELALLVCVQRGHFRSDVEEAVLAVLSNQVLPDGSLGLFHPDRFSFGDPVYLSSVYAAVHAVAGVESVDVTVFQRLREPDTSAIDTGVLDMHRLEIARLDNDPNFPEHGTVTLTMGGGT